jgi:hypothetical protein
MSRDIFPEQIEGLTNIEKSLLDSFTEENQQEISRLYREDLNSEKNKIVGLRSEDLLFFLQCIQHGFIPVGFSALMGKSEEGLYVSVNPESEGLQKTYPGLVEKASAANFKEAILKNSWHYSGIAIKQGIVRNILSQISDQENFWKSFYDEFIAKNPAYETHGLEYPEDMDLIREEFFDNAVRSIIHPKQQMALYKARLLDFMRRFFPNFRFKDFSSLQGRKGILIGFDETILQYPMIPETDMKGEEIIFSIPEGKLNLTHVLGFQSLGGPFEEEVLERIGVVI